ncbi:hypothetical protein [Tropicimonas sp.]|uniref:hypothetical protein n=1 Tax=Tropicimonas sp. TaxID=2067044 RepID=UPI003A85407E
MRRMHSRTARPGAVCQPALSGTSKTVRASLGLAREQRKGVGEQLPENTGAGISVAFAGDRRDEGGDAEPFETVMAGGQRPRATGRPDPAANGLQPDPMLVGGDDLDDSAGMFGLCRCDLFGKVFLNVAWSSDVAARAWRRQLPQPCRRSANLIEGGSRRPRARSA